MSAWVGSWGKVLGRVRENEGDLVGMSLRFNIQIFDRGVGGADDDPIQPGDGEQDPAVVRVGHHDGRLAAEERPIQNHVHAATGLHDRLAIRFVQTAHCVGEGAGGVNDAAGIDRDFAAADFVLDDDTADDSVAAPQFPHVAVVQERRTFIGRGLGQIDHQAGVVELAVVVLHAAPQARGFQARDALDGFGGRQVHRRAEAVLAGQQVVQTQTDAVEGPFPPVIRRHDERQVMHQMRRVVPQDRALAQSLKHQRNIALLQITHAAVHKLGAATGCALAKVAAF